MCKLQLLFRLPLLFHLLCLQPIGGSGKNQTLNYLSSHMNPAIDPCLDFYEFACGGWAKAHPSHSYYSQLGLLDRQYKSRLITMLQRSPMLNEPQFVQLLRDNYNSCRRQRGRFEPKQFVRFLLQWSSIELTQETSSNWLRLLKWLKAEFHLQLSPHYKGISPAEKTAIDWLRQIGANWPSLTAVGADVTEFLPLTHDQFKQLYGQLQPLGMTQEQLWPQIEQLELQLTQVPENLSGKPLKAAEFPDYWLLPLPLQQQQQQPPLESKLMFATHWRRYKQRLPDVLATQSLPLLTRYALLRLLHKLQQREAPTFKPQECATQTHELLPHAAVWLVQQQQTPLERQQTVNRLQQLFEQLRQRFERQLQRNRNHFVESTQRLLYDKLQRMRLRVSVLPGGDGHEEQRLLETHYAQLRLNGSDYFGNLLAILQHIQDVQLQKDLLELSDSGGRTAKAASLHLLQPDGYGSYASPYFMPGRNLVMVPHSLLAPPIYWPQQPAVLMHSALGFLIAHEMSHGFSPTDVIFDGRGNLATRSQRRRLYASRRFANQTRCLRDNYRDMADEKFCDINGLTLAFEAFVATSSMQEEEEDEKEEEEMGNNESLHQLFFINVAQFFCQKDEMLEESEIHGGNRQRVNDAVFTLEAFNKAFACNWQPRHECQLY